MREIRAFVREDLAGIVDLYVRVFGPTFPPEKLAPYFAKIFFEHPWIEENLPSLVYEESKQIVGFLGVIPRRMWLGDRPILLAVSNHFMVDRLRRSSLAGIELMKAFFAGPQELSLAEGNGSSRKVWEAMGGFTSLLYSLHWTRPLRPAGYVMSHLRRKEVLPAALARLASPVGRLVDNVVAWTPHSPFHPTPTAPEEDMTVDTLLECFSTLPEKYTLRPC